MQKSKCLPCLASLKRELQQRGEVWPKEAFSAPKEVAKRATAAVAILKFSNLH